MLNRQVISSLGDTENKGGGYLTLPVWVEYKHLGIQFTFTTALWEDNSNPISIVTIYKPVK